MIDVIQNLEEDISEIQKFAVQLENENFSADITISMLTNDFEKFNNLCPKTKCWDLFVNLDEKRKMFEKDLESFEMNFKNISLTVKQKFEEEKIQFMKKLKSIDHEIHSLSKEYTDSDVGVLIEKVEFQTSNVDSLKLIIQKIEEINKEKFVDNKCTPFFDIVEFKNNKMKLNDLSEKNIKLKEMNEKMTKNEIHLKNYLKDLREGLSKIEISIQNESNYYVPVKKYQFHTHRNSRNSEKSFKK
eukprot:gene9877-2199_t